MPAAEKPADECKRMGALQNYNILDTASEKEYDDITRLASIICDTPIALISIVDSERQWFKSTVGLDAQETPRELAFCAHAILNADDMLVVEDATKDPRFADNALVTGDPNIRFYAGSPLNTSSGHALGTLCAIDTKPKTLLPHQAEALRVLADNVVNLLELRKGRLQCDRLIDQLKSSNEELERFAYVASHDLQEPLRMISNFTKLLEEDLGDSLDGNAREYLNICCSAAIRMQRLINDILEYARVNRELATYEDVECMRLMEYIQDNLRETIDDRQASITYDALPTITSNGVRLSRILQNLIGNAIKYQSPQSTPSIHISIKAEGEDWTFCVQDNGIGIEPDYHQQVFQLFERLHSKGAYPGTGIGLAISQKIIEGMGGRIWVESTLGEGAAFYFTLPKDPTKR